MDVEKKKYLLQILIDKMSNEVNSMTESIDGDHKTIREAPGAKTSWSDTTRSQHEGLIKGKMKLLADSNKALSATKRLEVIVTRVEIAQLGSVVEVQDTAGKQEIYLIVPRGGDKIAFEGKEITLLSYSSLLATALIGHRKGDRIKVQIPDRTRALTILEIS